MLGVIKALNQGDDGGLTTATGATQSHDAVFLGVHRERNTFKNLNVLFSRIPEEAVAELQVTFDLAFDFVATLSIYFGLILHKLNNLVGGADNRGHVSKDHTGDHKVEVEGKHVVHERCDLTHRDLVVIK